MQLHFKPETLCICKKTKRKYIPSSEIQSGIEAFNLKEVFFVKQFFNSYWMETGRTWQAKIEEIDIIHGKDEIEEIGYGKQENM